MKTTRCTICSREIKNCNIAKHSIACLRKSLRRPNRPGNPGHRGGNQFTRARELGVLKPTVSIETRKKIAQYRRGKITSDATRAKISKSRVMYLEANPDKVPYLSNHSSKGPSYPELYWIDLIKKEYLDLGYHRRVGRYELDFFNDLKMIDLEIDGEQHYVDAKIVRSDIHRTEFLQEKGWQVIRVRWAEWQRKSVEEKQAFVTDLKQLLESR